MSDFFAVKGDGRIYSTLDRATGFVSHWQNRPDTVYTAQDGADMAVHVTFESFVGVVHTRGDEVSPSEYIRGRCYLTFRGIGQMARRAKLVFRSAQHFLSGGMGLIGISATGNKRLQVSHFFLDGDITPYWWDFHKERSGSLDMAIYEPYVDQLDGTNLLCGEKLLIDPRILVRPRFTLELRHRAEDEDRAVGDGSFIGVQLMDATMQRTDLSKYVIQARPFIEYTLR